MSRREPSAPETPAATSSAPVAAAAAATPARTRSRTAARVLVGVLLALGLYALLGYWALPKFAREPLAQALSQELERPVAIGRLEFDPFLLRLRVHELRVADAQGPGELAGFDQLEVDFSSRSLLRFAPVVSSLRLQGPLVRLVRDARGEYNVGDLIRKWSAPPPQSAPPSRTPRFSIANVEIDGGRVEFDDAFHDARHEIASLTLRLPFVSSLPVDEAVYVEPHLSATVDGTAMRLDVRALPFRSPKDWVADIDLQPIDLVRFAGYLPDPPVVELQSAKLGGALRITVEQPNDAPPKVTVSGRTTIADIAVAEPGGGPLFAAESIDIESIEANWPQNRHSIGRITVTGPELSARRRAGAARFFEPVLAALEKRRASSASTASTAQAPSPSPSSSPSADWRIDEFVVKGGRVALVDEAFEPKPLRLAARDFEATVQGIGSDAAQPAKFQASLALAGGEKLHASGAATWQTGAVDATVKLADVALQRWWWIVEQNLAVDAVGGSLSADARVLVSPVDGAASSVRIDGGALRLRDVSLRQRWDQRTLVALPQLDLERVRADFAARSVEIGSVQAQGGKLLIRRGADARMNVELAGEPGGGAPANAAASGTTADAKPPAGAKPFAAKPTAAKPTAAKPTAAKPTAAKPTAAKPSAAKPPVGKRPTAKPPTAKPPIAERPLAEAPVAKPPAKPAAAKPPAATPPTTPAWALSIAQIGIDRLAVDVEDEAAGKSANLRVESLALDVTGLSSADNAKAATVLARARIDSRGSLDVAGQMTLRPFDATLRVAARGVPIVALQPYFTDYVDAIVSRGAAGFEGDLQIAAGGDAPARVRYRGGASVADFVAVTKTGRRDLLAWKTLAIGGIDFATAPMTVVLGEIALSGLRSRLIISREGRFNLQDVIVDRKPAARDDGATRASVAASDAQAPAPVVRIGGVRLTNGNIDFSDFFVRPNYSANLTGLNGGISRIERDRPGEVELRGRVDQTGSVEIRGQINPLAESLFLDIRADARDIDLPRLSPYSTKYVGYGIEKGKLSAKVEYKVVDRQLTGQNQIVLDQLTFGEKVESPDAIQLPVLFAVALLKDRNGVIDVSLPIGGSLDDPQFSVGGIVLRLIGNLIVKAVTAPFALIANLAGAGGEQLSWLGFAAGSASIDSDTQEKLAAITKALTDRPGLKLDVAGRADPSSDREALRKHSLLRALKVRKARETGSPIDADSLDATTLDPQEVAKYLEREYRDAKFERPRNRIGMLERLPPEQMEAMLLEHVQVGDARLTRLADERAQQVKEQIVGAGISGERIFVVASKIDGGAPAGGGAAGPGDARAPASRVDLSLK